MLYGVIGILSHCANSIRFDSIDVCISFGNLTLDSSRVGVDSLEWIGDGVDVNFGRWTPFGEFFLELFGDLSGVLILRLLGGLVEPGDLGVLARLGVCDPSGIGLFLADDGVSLLFRPSATGLFLADAGVSLVAAFGASAIVTLFGLGESGVLACKLVLRALGVTGEIAEEGRLRVGVVGGGLGSGGLEFVVSMKLGRSATLGDFI